MPTLADLDPMSKWIGHEVRCLARTRGWCSKRAGVESLFRNRPTALRIICTEFSIENLMLRAFPDMILRSMRETRIIEVKDRDGNYPPSHPNVSIELHQLLLLRALGGDTWYCFGWPDHARRRLEARMIQARHIEPARILVPRRARTWPHSLRALMNSWIDREGWRSRCEQRDATRGSRDPFALLNKADLNKADLHRCADVRVWLDEISDRGCNKQFRIGWEGKDDAHAEWAHEPPPGGWRDEVTA